MNRLLSEYRTIQSETHPDYTVNLVFNNFFHWEGSLQGPQNTPYENKQFSFEIIFPHKYPESYPKFFFQTEICHPSVCAKSGKFCLRALYAENDKNIRVRTIIAYVLYLLANFDPDIGYIEGSCAN